MELKIILSNLVIAAILFSCDGKQSGDTGESADNDLLSGNSEWNSNERNDFIRKARQNNLTEIRAGEIAQTKAQSAEVKEFGQTLVNDHRNANQKLDRISQQQGQQNQQQGNQNQNLQQRENQTQNQQNQNNQQNQQSQQNQQQGMNNELDDEHRQKIQNLQETNNQEFDKKFLDQMIQDHEKAINDFEDAQEKADQQLKSYIEGTLPVLRKHLETAKRLQDQQKNNN